MLPVWYKSAKPLIESGKLAMLGVVQEQHAERAQLYKQWKQFDFPIAQDATTSLNLAVVPMAILIDEFGVVRNRRPRPGDLATFVEQNFEPLEKKSSGNQQSEKPIDNKNSKAEQLIEAGHRCLHDIDGPKIEEAIEHFTQAITMQSDKECAQAKFSLGVALRMRFDISDASNLTDFAAASENWSQALKINPNQYIWRRRIEQYGPKLKKPYPFYDWVDDAIADIKKRGEKPIKLKVKLTGSEIAGPTSTFTSEASEQNPDPESKILQSEKTVVQLKPSIVPAVVKPGSVVRVHLNLQTVQENKWNNEAEPLSVWINESSNGTPEKRLIQFVRDASRTPSRTRNIDFEFKTDKDSDEPVIDGYVLFHICDKEGVCFYYRKNFKIPVKTNAK